MGWDGRGFNIGSMGLMFWMNASTVRLEQKTPGPINRIDGL